ncbi:uroporphyrinogen-III synthase [Noviherbaspirillum humi]|uniref:Uroporphyrinogen-III synthase n=2 Tax=Noviherbaspirillum humi TaxID=1688639 RepID=A0A239GU15_9BURK|nr:uroporphyrinogen-III synthase [Noviherbaspirillum humi]
MPKVVVTRPLSQARPLAQRLAAAGYETALFPLLEISPLADEGPLKSALQELSRFALVAFVSPNAIDAAFAHVRQWPAEVPIGIMGEGSRRALEAHGIGAANATIISPRDPARTDSETLLQVLDLELLRGRTVLILRGESGRELLADALRAAGIDVLQVAAYRRTAPAFDETRRVQLRQLLADDSAWIITSSEALRFLMQMASELGAAFVARMQHKRLIIPHVRIAETAKALGFSSIVTASSGDDGILAALQSSA